MTAQVNSTTDRWTRGINRNIAVAILGNNPTTILNNRIGGAINLAARLPVGVRTKFFARVGLDLLTLDTTGLKAAKWVGVTANVEAARKILQSPYMVYRWVDNPAHHLVVATKEDQPGQIAKGAWRDYFNGLQELSLHPMAYAEMMNAVDAYRTLIANNYSHNDALKVIEDATRETQNPVTPLEKSDMIRVTQTVPAVWMLFPFVSQSNVARNMLRVDYLAWDTAEKGEAKTKAGRQLAATVVSLIGSTLSTVAVWTSVSALMYGLFKPDDDDEGIEDFVEDVVGESLNMVFPSLGSAAQSFYRVLRDKPTFGRGLILQRAFERMLRSVNSAQAGEYGKAADELIRGVSVFAGVPYYGTSKIPRAVYNTLRPVNPDDAKKAYRAHLRAWVQPSIWLSTEMSDTEQRKYAIDSMSYVDGLLAKQDHTLKEREKAFNGVRNGIRTQLYESLWDAVADKDDKKIQKLADALVKLGAEASNVISSARTRELDDDAIRRATKHIRYQKKLIYSDISN